MRDELIKTYGTKQHKVVTLIAVIYDTMAFTVMVACLLQLIFGLQVEQQSNMIILWTLVPHINIDFNGVSRSSSQSGYSPNYSGPQQLAQAMTCSFTAKFGRLQLIVRI